MKRLLPILAVFTLLLPAVCSASGYVLANYVIGGEIDEPSLGVEIGGIFLSDLHPTGGALSFGLGVSVADTDEDPPSAAHPLPAQTYDYLKKYNEGYEQEIDITFGAEMIPAFFAVGGVGYASQDTTTIGVSGSQPYEVETDTDRNVTWMLGARYVIEGLNIGLGFHSRRGIMASVGIAF
jgi:hypothetical protein